MKKNSQDGFTLVELIFTLIILVILVVLPMVLCTGNFWFTDNGALCAIQVDYPEASRVLATQRNIFQPSVVTVENKDGSKTKYYLESDIFFNYDIQPRK